MKSRCLVVVGACLATAGCYSHKTSNPAEVSFALDFPSTAAAVLSQSVDVYVFSGDQSCTDLISDVRNGEQNLPAALFVTPALSPCQIAASQGNTFSLASGDDYTMLAIAQGPDGKDQLVGCAVQPSFAATEALSISLTFIDNHQAVGTTTCTKLSDKCNSGC